MSIEKNKNIQDQFLHQALKGRVSVTVFLINGVKLQGIITGFDNFSILLRRDGVTQLLYKHAVSTVMPSGSLNLSDCGEGESAAQSSCS